MSDRTPPQRTLRSIHDLEQAGLVAADAVEALRPVAARYAVTITPAMAALINPGNAHDPIAAQFIPDPRELITQVGENADPIGDDVHSPVEGIVHRYPDRALLKIVHSCPVYCRFCFRREMVGPSKPALNGTALERALDYIAQTPAIWEVILTGGDPFVLSARRAKDITARLASIDHVRIIRWHTRVPVVDPARVTPAFVKSLRAPGVATWVAIHANHASEFTDAARAAIARLADGGIALVSQSVLLKGVNDTPQALEALMRAFTENRIKPYYLHHGDMAPGTGHRRTTIREGQALMKGLRGKLSGLAQPTYVLDIPGGFGKVPIGPDYIACDNCAGEPAQVEDPHGRMHNL
jgi:lysine 2,3-aminomutase